MTTSNIQLFLKNHLNKDIDQNFIDSLEAILFLTPPKKEELNTIFTLTVNSQDMDDSSYSGTGTNLARLLKEKLKSQPNSYYDSYGQNDDISRYNRGRMYPSKNSVTYEYNLADFFMYKLNENLRRCYSEEKSKDRSRSYRHKPHENNKDYLIKSQNYIYQAMDMLSDHISFDTNKKHYSKAILGKDSVMTSIELWTYLNCHEFLTSENKNKHLHILNTHFEEHKFSSNFIKEFKNFIYKKDDIETINLVLKNSDSKDIVETLKNSHNLKFGWTFAALNHIIDNDELDISDADKHCILNSIIYTKLLDSQFYNTFISDTSEFENKLSLFFQKLFNNEDRAIINTIVNKVELQSLGKSNTYSFLLNQINRLDDPHLLANTISVTNVNPAQKEMIYKLYDWDDKNIIKKCVDIINFNSYSTEKIHDLLTIRDNASNKELLAYIISVDSKKYMDICKSAYMKIKLEERVNKDNSSSHSSHISKAFKI